MTRQNNTDLKDVWETPDDIFDMLDPFDVDPCAGQDTGIGTEANFTVEDDGLAQDWFGRVFVNPPFSQKTDWLQKAIDEQQNTECIYVLTPDSTDTISWWHGKIAPHADYIWFSEGRISYVVPASHADEFEDYEAGEKAGSPTFGTALSIFGEPTGAELERLHENGQLLKTVDPTQ